jgi:hypothetical protein
MSPLSQISVGCVRARFAWHIAVLILIDACASALGFWLLGFAFAFGDGQDASGNLYGNTFIGFNYFALHGADGAQYFATAVRPYAFWVFEWAVSLYSQSPSHVIAEGQDMHTMPSCVCSARQPCEEGCAAPCAAWVISEQTPEADDSSEVKPNLCLCKPFCTGMLGRMPRWRLVDESSLHRA